jgi:hypothetical protein
MKFESPTHQHSRFQFQQLNTMVRPGLTDVEFTNLFVKCGACNLIMACQVYGFHHCESGEEVEDLIDVETEIDSDVD